MSCLRLKNIHENRKDDIECSLCGQCINEHEQDIVCVDEGGAFMSDQDLSLTQAHPYKQWNPDYKAFKDTTVVFPAYSLPARPYAWLMKNNARVLAKTEGFAFHEEYEPNLNFDTTWVQEARNQRAIFDSFYRNVIPDESLCLIYAKQVPFVEDNRRVIIGIGHVKKVIPAQEYEYAGDSKVRCLTWETMICHSIREDHKDGFLIPYTEMMKYAEDHPDFNMASVTVFAPDDMMTQFSYATEHVSHDAVIDVLLSCIRSFTVINECLDEDYSDVLKWLNEQLALVWEDRGAFPGLGAMLSAFNISLGIPMAREIRANLPEGEDIWKYLDNVLAKPTTYLSKCVANTITPIIQKTWKSLPEQRKKLFRLLSRFDLNIDQAKVFYNENERRKSGIEYTDLEIIENPYILYEQTRLKADDLCLSVRKVDRAIFPVPSIAEKYPLEEPSRLKSDNDERRIRAVVISVMEDAALKGHTFLPCDLLVDEIQQLTLDPACTVTKDIVSALESFMKSQILKREMKDGTEYYKLQRLNDFDKVIERRVRKRISAPKIGVHADWKALLNTKLGNTGNSKKEALARNEKAAALEMLAESRLSVLVGDAGTGKTTVLSILCSEKSIAAGGVMLLAPTGKATVRLKGSVGVKNDSFTAYNVAQFLVKSRRFNWDDMRYKLSGQHYTELPETVIIDESSMLTEEMFGALLDAIGTVKRIIFVGDPNQLPPIGTGKPFVDLVNLLKENVPEYTPIDQPRVFNCYAELRINRRQQSEGERMDVALSKCFTKSEEKLDTEDIISDIVQGKSKNISIVKWNTREDLEDKLLHIVASETGMNSVDDQQGFDKALGASVSAYETFFNAICAERVDDWQILAPVKNMPQGVASINRLIHQKYRQHQLELAKQKGYMKRIPAPYGDDEVVYGDKVINVQNMSRNAYPQMNAENYVANGEIGIACGLYKKNYPKNVYLNVSFSSQQGFTYTYDGHDFNNELGTNALELAYALTVHKSQGSQFDTVILVIAEPCRITSRELLYTALTRQVNKIVILYNEEPYHLLKYSSEVYSDISKRFTDLFADVFPDDDGRHKPQIIKVGNTFFDENLIHRTIRGELVRSKSEAIIANALAYHNLTYEYEPVLELEGKQKRPDFKIIEGDTGETWYWEHCGMLTDPTYKKRWEEKKKFYKKNGIEEGKNLIVTQDGPNGSLDTAKIEKIIEETFE